jgi:hypothetical protein
MFLMPRKGFKALKPYETLQNRLKRTSCNRTHGKQNSKLQEMGSVYFMRVRERPCQILVLGNLKIVIIICNLLPSRGSLECLAPPVETHLTQVPGGTPARRECLSGPGS